MIAYEQDVVIARPIEAVFDRLADIASYSEWLPRGGLFVDSSVDGPVEVGARYVDRTIFGRVHGEIVDLERPQKLAFRYVAQFLGMRIVEGRPCYRLEPIDEATTRVRHTLTARTAGVFRLIEPAIGALIRRERRRTVLALKDDLDRDRFGH